MTSEEIAKQLLTASIRHADALVACDATIPKLRKLLAHEPFLYNVVQQPRSGGERGMDSSRFRRCCAATAA